MTEPVRKDPRRRAAPPPEGELDAGRALSIARDCAEEALLRAWGRGRARLAPAGSRLVAVGARLCVQVRFRVWEACGVARVELDARAALTRLSYPDADPLDVGQGEGPTSSGAAARGDPGVRAAVLAACAAAAGRREGRVAPRVRARRVDVAVDVRPRGGQVVRVALERVLPDGRAVVEVDARALEVVAWRCPPLLRGSRRSGALGRAAAEARARGLLEVAPDARLAQARLLVRAEDRTWRLRFVEGARAQSVVVNARTGHVAAWSSEDAPADREAAGRAGQEVARERVLLVAQARLGPGAQVGALIPGASGRARRPVWIGVVTTAERGVWRATFDGGRVVLVRSR